MGSLNVTDKKYKVLGTGTRDEFWTMYITTGLL